MPLSITSIRRYPVKSMGGEPLDTVEVDQRGLVGDRWYAVTDQDGKLASGKSSTRFRRHDAVFGYSAATDGDQVLVSGTGSTWRVGEPELDDELSAAFGVPVSVQPESSVPHYDGGAVSLIGSATLDWMARHWEVNADPRRLRVNLVIETQEPFVEETWTGGELTAGEVRLDIERRVPRCRMIDIDQDGAEAEGALLKLLGEHRELCAAVYAGVLTPGRTTAGDPVTVLPR